ncbi:MAG: flippase-like domain-containing protein [Phycisphaerae bacterium]|nr:flippase-like domain-containing protein [Phycisphaerae bacterium]
MADGEPNKSKRILVLLRVLVVVGGVIAVVVWLSREGRWAELKAIFARMDMWVFVCVFAVFCFSQFMVGLRWWLLLRTQGIFIGLWAAVRLYLLGWFYNNVMPGSVGGDLIRLWYVTKHTEKKFEAGLSVLVDRAIGLLSTLMIASFFYVVFLRSEKIAFAGRGDSAGLLSRYWWLIVAAASVVFGGLLTNSRGRALLARLGSRVRTGGAKAFRKLLNAGRLYGRSPLVICATFALTVVLQITTITGFWFLGRNLGIEASITYYYVFFTLVWVLGAVPVSIGGAVVVEGMLVWLFVNYAAVAETDAMALALCQRFVWLLGSLPGAMIHLIGAHLPKDFSS